jgi:hypothetical protein
MPVSTMWPFVVARSAIPNASMVIKKRIAVFVYAFMASRRRSAAFVLVASMAALVVLA